MALEMNSPKEPAKRFDSLNINELFVSRKQVPYKDRLLFIEQLALMLETGNDLYTSLIVLAKQSGNSELSRVITVISDEVSEGQTFSSALSRHPNVFSNTYVSLIAASESGGYTQRILEHLLQMEKQRQELRSTVISAISYPVFLIVFSFGMVVFILAVVFPKFGTLFASIQDQLPVTTIFLMALSRIITQYWWAVGGGIIMLLVLIMLWIKSDTGKHVFDRLQLNMPGLKSLFIKVYLIQTMRILALSLKNGVNLVEALTLAKGVVNNRGFNDFLDRVLDDVIEGGSLTHGFNASKFIPPLVQQLILTGEHTGNLALVSDRIADYFQRDLEKLLKLFSKAIEPILLLVMGLVVGVLVSSLILPIFKLSHAVH